MSKVANPAQRGLNFQPTKQDKFEEFLELNPGFFDEFVKIARELVGKGLTWLSADWILHYMRIYSILHIQSNTDYRINDHISSRISRKVIAECPDLAPYFRTRKLRAA